MRRKVERIFLKQCDCPITKKMYRKINDAFPDQQTRKPPVRLPTISIANITSEMSAEEIKNTVLAQNTSIERLISSGLTFEVMSVRPQKSNNKFYSTVRVSNHIREHIEQYLGNRLYVGMSRCEVYVPLLFQCCSVSMSHQAFQVMIHHLLKLVCLSNNL